MIEPDSELNAAVARDVMRWTALGAHLWQDRHTGTVYYTGHDPTRVFVPHVVFDPSREALHAALVEHQIEHLGKWQAYLFALVHEVDLEAHAVNQAYATGYPSPEDALVVRQALRQATPAQRCRAALHGMAAPPA
jgi:hypothetical protein